MAQLCMKTVGGRDRRDVTTLLATGLMTIPCLQRHNQRRSSISPVGPVVNDRAYDSNNVVSLLQYRSSILAVEFPAQIPL
jgi:hypothetical protein